MTFGDGRKSATATGGAAMLDREWYSLAVAIDPVAGTVSIEQKPLVPYARTKDAFAGTFGLEVKPAVVEAPLYLAGCPEETGTVGRHFDGKIDGPTLLSGIHPRPIHEALLRAPLDQKLARQVIAKWDFSREMRSLRAVDVGPSRRARRPRQPADARHEGLELDRRGAFWVKQARALRRRPLPHDDVYDAGWETSVSVRLPDDIR